MHVIYISIGISVGSADLDFGGFKQKIQCKERALQALAPRRFTMPPRAVLQPSFKAFTGLCLTSLAGLFMWASADGISS